jgi:hypothetical protein
MPINRALLGEMPSNKGSLRNGKSVSKKNKLNSKGRLRRMRILRRYIEQSQTGRSILWRH